MTPSEVQRTALVTGAGSGMGRAFATELARRGYRLVLVDVAAEGLSTLPCHPRDELIVTDLARPESIAIVEHAVARTGGALDLVVHCAGVLSPGRFDEQPPEA